MINDVCIIWLCSCKGSWFFVMLFLEETIMMSRIILCLDLYIVIHTWETHGYQNQFKISKLALFTSINIWFLLVYFNLILPWKYNQTPNDIFALYLSSIKCLFTHSLGMLAGGSLQLATQLSIFVLKGLDMLFCLKGICLVLFYCIVCLFQFSS